MIPPRFYCPMPLMVGRRVSLPDAAGRHAINVLRLRDGDPVVLFNGDGSEYFGQILRRGVGAEVLMETSRETVRESHLTVTLVQGVSSGERMDYTLQKAVELGVSAVQPVMMRRTVVRLAGDKRERRRQHWQRIAIAACEQCGRNRVPEVRPVLEFAAWLPSTAAAKGSVFLLSPEDGQRLRDLPAPAGPVTLIVGPEGGLDPAERQSCIGSGFLSVRLGPRVLRTETAGLAALAAMQALWGDL